ncbi:MAG: efflux RND transporter permease subunit [Alkalispirochaeta sp.]
MMIVSDFSVRHPVIVSILIIVLLVFGTIAFTDLNREMIPSVGLPEAHIITAWPGAGTEEVEEAITRRIENQLSTLAGTTSISSISKDSYSLVELQFSDGTDVYARLPEIRELLNTVASELPDDIDGEPEILIAEANGLIPIFSFQVESSVDPIELSRFLDDHVSPRLARIPGVAQINIVGAAEEELRVTLDPVRAQTRGIDPIAVLNAITYGNRDIPAGEASYRGRELPLTTEGAFVDITAVRSLVVGSDNGAFVHLGDIATVEARRAEDTIAIRSGGSDTVVIDVLKRDDGNTIEIVNEAEKTLYDLTRENPGVFSWKTVSDHREMTDRSINTVISSAVVGTILATLMILLFLHDIRATVIIAVSIPLSVLFTFAAMRLTGQTINLLTLSGITVAIGMIVDASIVTLENTWKHFHSTGDRLNAARLGAGEVASAILASTLTSVSVFAPLAFLTGIIGIIMKDLSLTIVYALTASAIVAVAVVPFLASVLLRPENAPRKSRFITRLDRGIDRVFFAIQARYRRGLSRALANGSFVVLIATAILATSVALLSTLPVSFLPPTDTGEFEVHIETPRTYSLEQTIAVVDEIDRIVSGIVPERDTGVFYAGASSSLAIAGSPNQAFGRIRLVERARRDRSVQELIPLVQHAIDRNVPDANVTVLNGGFDALLGMATGGQGYQITVSGTDLLEVVRVADTAREYLETDPDVLKAETNTDYDAEQLFLSLRRDEMATLGVSAYEAGLTARILMNGVDAGSYTGGVERIPIRLVSDLANRQVDEDTVHLLSLRNAENTLVTFAAFSEIAPRRTVSTIHKQDRAISATVRGYLYDEDQSGVSVRMETFLDALDLPPGITWERAGTSELIVDSMKSLGAMLAIAIFLVYVVMVIQFERYAQPLVIMAAVPLCLIGVVLGLLVFSSALSIIAMLGLITLGGTVVNNAIVMVDHINTLRTRDGMELEPAIIDGASGRLRPVLMTTVTTLFAVLPMALAVGDGSEVYAPLGQAIFGGLLTSTAITLFLVPVLYRFVETRRTRRGGGGPPGSGAQGDGGGPPGGGAQGGGGPPGSGPSRAPSGGTPGPVRIAFVVIVVLAAVPVPEAIAQTHTEGSTEHRDLQVLRERSHRQSDALTALIDFSEPFSDERIGGEDPENREIAIARSRHSASSADLSAARARRLPELALNADAAWIANPPEPVTIQPGELGTIPFSDNPMLGMDDVVLPAEETELFEGTEHTRYEVGVSVLQPLYTSGTIENAIAAAAAAERLALAQLAGTTTAVVSEIGATRETIAILDAILESLNLQTDAAERLVEISRESWINGFITEAEYLDARLAHREVLLARAELVEERGASLEHLALLLGEEPPGGETRESVGSGGVSLDAPVRSVPTAMHLPSSPEELLQRVETGNHELRALDALSAVEAARERIAGGERVFRPAIAVRIDLSWTGAFEDLDEESRDDRGDWQVTIGAGISTTIFDGGRSAADYRRSREETRQAELRRAHRRAEITSSLRNRLRRIDTLRAQLEHSEAVIAVRRQDVADAFVSWRAGAGGEEDVLTAIIDEASATTEGYQRLAEYRRELWAITALTGASY